MQKIFLAVFLLGMLAMPALAQTPGTAQRARAYPEHHTGFRCAFDSVQQAAWAQQPGAEAGYRAFLQAVAQRAGAEQYRRKAAPDVTVPVVMHIIHDGGSSNITDAQVYDALRVINEDFSKNNADTSDVIPFFRPRYANVGFRFRLARLDPNGNCTTGITRTYSAATNIGDDRVKSLIVWDQSRYLNVWVCNSANGAGGYAYLPCTGDAGDGIVIRNAQFGSIGTSGGSNLAIRSLTHEIGHYFGLPHTWGGTNTPGLPSNCGIDDGIADTPNTTGIQGGCNLSFAPCVDASNQPILANVQNYMDYSSCTRMFTTDQRGVMRAALQLGCRQQLTTATNLLSTGTNDGFTGGPCVPVVAFRASSTQICAGSTVTFLDDSYNADLTAAGTSYSWTFVGGTPATSALRTPTVTYNSGGIYDVTLTITTPGGAGTRTLSRLVQVIGNGSGLTGPVTESFETATFPANFPAPDLRNWTTSASVTGGSARWQRLNASTSSLVASDGAAFVVVRSQLLPRNTLVWLTSPNIDLSGFSAAAPPVLTFDRAYALQPTQANEVLSVQFSTDCGVTWDTQASFLANQLNTNGTLRTNGYGPETAAEWQPLSVSIDPNYLGSRFQLRFQLSTRQGNPLYLDRLNIGQAQPTATRATDAAHYGLSVYPNPYTAETAVHLTLPAPATVQVQVTDLLGRPVLHLGAEQRPAGAHTLPLPGPALAPGLYLVQVRVGDLTLTQKLLVR